MAWFSGKVSLGGFPDIAGAVNKLSESVKNIEKNFDSALGLEERSDSSIEGLWPAMSFMGHKSDDLTLEKGVMIESPQEEDKDLPKFFAQQGTPIGNENKLIDEEKDDIPIIKDITEAQPEMISCPELIDNVVTMLDPYHSQQKYTSDEVDDDEVLDVSEEREAKMNEMEESSLTQADVASDIGTETTSDMEFVPAIAQPDSLFVVAEETIKACDSDVPLEMVVDSVSQKVESNISSAWESDAIGDVADGGRDQNMYTVSKEPPLRDSVDESEKLKTEMKTMELALQGAARQAKAKADEIATLMNENEHLKTVVEELQRRSDAEVESLREECHQKVATLERKAYALTKERDTLRREQSKRSDTSALLKEKDDIINQVMAEGEELSKKQAAQESTIRKLRAQIREFEEDKKGLIVKLQVEEGKVEAIKTDKIATETLLQEMRERHQEELASQKEYYVNALNAAREDEAMAKARATNEARTELEGRLREAEEREAFLVQAIDELRHTLSRKEQQAIFKEDMLCRDIDDLQKHYQASERRCEELISQVPESTRPLLRQIEVMQETTARRSETWAAVERTLSSQLQEAETKAASAEERERSTNERLSQTLSRTNVLEAQISCVRAEQTQLGRALEKERQRAAEIRQEFLSAREEAGTQKDRACQLEEEIQELRQKDKRELEELQMDMKLLRQELEKEKSARLDFEVTSHGHSNAMPDHSPIGMNSSTFENGNLTRRHSSAGSIGSMDESHFLQASFEKSDSFSESRNLKEATLGPFYMKNMTPSAFEAALRQKDGQLACYISRLTSVESIRDTLAEELVKITAQCEKLRREATLLPGIRAELEGLRQRHSAALELMGEHDEELEELRADVVDLKEMYREQVNLLVNKIQTLCSSVGATA